MKLPNNPGFRPMTWGHWINKLAFILRQGKETTLGVSARKDLIQGTGSLQNGLKGWWMRNGVATTGLLSSRACHCCHCCRNPLWNLCFSTLTCQEQNQQEDGHCLSDIWVLLNGFNSNWSPAARKPWKFNVLAFGPPQQRKGRVEYRGNPHYML